jgi:hypothetical protein
VFTTDHVLLVLGPIIDRILREEAPGVSLRFLPSVVEDWLPLRDGAADLSVCILGHFPPEFRTRRIFTDRFGAGRVVSGGEFVSVAEGLALMARGAG